MLMNKYLRSLSEAQCIAWVIALSFLMRSITVLVLKIDPTSDYLAYDQMARNLIAGRVMADNFGNVAFYSGGYPLFFLAPIYTLFGHSLLSVQIGNAALGALSTYLVYLLLREAKAGAIARIIGPLMFALYVPSWLYCEYLAKENLMTPLLLLLMYLAARMYHDLAVSSALATGVVIGLLAITGTSGMALLPLPVIAIILAKSSNQTKLGAGIAFMLAAALLLAPWQYRNAQLLGSPVVTTNGGFNLYLGNNPNADGFFVSIADTQMGEEWRELRKKGEIYASDHLKNEAIRWIVNNPKDFAGLALKKAVLFWMPPVHEGKGRPSTIESVTRIIWLFEYIMLCLPAIYILITMRRRNDVVLGIGASIILYTGIHMIFYVIFRYREPIMPMVVILAAIGLEAFALRFFKHPVKVEPPFYEHDDIDMKGQFM
jgi:4-amino-4-deoxy-L-arabinose transferase-like glycosyltransferase